MKLYNYSKVYFLGIGGIGMSALARWFHKAGYIVAGYDRAPSDITQSLAALGIDIAFTDEPDIIPQSFKTNCNKVLVVYTPAIPQNHKGFIYFKNNAYTVIKRSIALGLIVKDKQCIAIAGTHGKTSVSTITANILSHSQIGCSAFLGGISKNFESNFLLQPQSNNVVVEADEFDRSFLTLNPNFAVITAVDADHLDIYNNKNEVVKAFAQFASQIKKGGTLVLKNGVSLPFDNKNDINIFTYSVNGPSNFYAQNIVLKNGLYHFNLVTPNGLITDIFIGTPALYNLENGIAAAAVAFLAGASHTNIRQGLANYTGVKRRFDTQVNNSQFVYIDDYAHHPEEIIACCNSLRDLYPGKTITAVFQPHLYSRTRDFANDFADSLSRFDKVIITDIYPAREEPIPGISALTVFDKITITDKVYCQFNMVVETLKNSEQQVIVTMGAGDIDKLVEPIKQMLLSKCKCVN